MLFKLKGRGKVMLTKNLWERNTKKFLIANFTFLLYVPKDTKINVNCVCSGFFFVWVAAPLKANSRFGWKIIWFSGWSSESCAEILHYNIGGFSFIQISLSWLTCCSPSLKQEGVGGQKREDNWIKNPNYKNAGFMVKHLISLKTHSCVLVSSSDCLF